MDAARRDAEAMGGDTLGAQSAHHVGRAQYAVIVILLWPHTHNSGQLSSVHVVVMAVGKMLAARAALLSALAAALVYLNSLRGDFVFDDMPGEPREREGERERESRTFFPLSSSLSLPLSLSI